MKECENKQRKEGGDRGGGIWLGLGRSLPSFAKRPKREKELQAELTNEEGVKWGSFV